MKSLLTIFVLFFCALISQAKTQYVFDVKYKPIYHRIPTMKVKIDEKYYDVLIDTGNPGVMVLNSSIFKSRPSAVQLVDRDNKILNISITDIVGTDLTSIEKSFGGKIYGILGFKFLSKFDFSLSLYENRLALFDEFRIPAMKSEKVVSIPEDPNLPFLSIPYNGKDTLDFLIDTGAEICNIREIDITSKAGLRFNFDQSDVEFSSMTRFGKIRVVNGIINEFTVGQAKCKNVELSISKGSTFVNIIGNNFLRNFKMSYFRLNKSIVFEDIAFKSKEFDSPVGELGFSVDKKADGFVVDYIRGDYSAGLSGLAIGDRVVSIDDRALSSFDQNELDKISIHPLSRFVKIDYVHGSTHKSISIYPTDIYTPQENTGLGFYMVFKDGNLIVQCVLEGSSAHSSGFAYGDVIISANDVVFSQSNFEQFKKEMQKDKVLIKYRPSDSKELKVAPIERKPLNLVPWLTRKRLLPPAGDAR